MPRWVACASASCLQLLRESHADGDARRSARVRLAALTWRPCPCHPRHDLACGRDVVVDLSRRAAELAQAVEVADQRQVRVADVVGALLGPARRLQQRGVGADEQRGRGWRPAP